MVHPRLFLDPNDYAIYVNGAAKTHLGGPLRVAGLLVFANNAAAIAGGLVAGDFYRTGGDPDNVCVVH
jgi:hypothetical protein